MTRGVGTGIAQVTASIAGDLARHGSRPALRAPTGTTTYAELAERVEHSRAALADLPGTRQLVHLRPAATADFVVAWLAALSGGHTALLSHDEGLARAYRASASLAPDSEGGRAWHPTGGPAPALHPDLRLLLSTSGSTGSPKLVRLSGAALDANAAAIASYLGLHPGDVALTTLPLDYCYGLSVLHSHLVAGASLVLDDRSVTEAGLWERARADGVTSFAGVPYTFDLLGQAGWPDLPTLRQVTQAGGRMAAERVRALATQGLREGWDLVVMYGQTEATARMAYLPPDRTLDRPGAVGVAVPGGHFRLAPVDGAEEGVGELVYRGPNVMMGYAEAPADLARGADVDELRTGDLARIDADGIVEIVGRTARFAKLFGQRIDLDRVQTLLALTGYDAACAESADGTALVVAVPGATDALAREEVAAAAADGTGLPQHAVRVVPVASLPRLPNGKVDHRTVAGLRDDRRPEEDSPLESVARLYARVLGRRDVGPDDTFVGLGGDSLSYVELSLRLERSIGPLPSTWQHHTVSELAARLDSGPAVGARGSARRGRWVRVDTTIALRAVAILLVVGSHTDLWVLLGGAHVLLAVAGANFARFHLADEDSGERLRRVLRASARVAAPAVLWIGGVALVTGDLGWRTVLLLNDLLGSKDWSEPAWHYWFVEVVLILAVGAGLLTAVPWVMRVERRHRFPLAASLTAAALVPRWWAEATSYGGDVLHSSLFVAWLFAGGWAAAVARGPSQRVVASALLLGGVAGFTGDVRRDLTIAAGLLVLVWLRTVPWPRLLVAATGTVASASLCIYLTHWQVYPWFEDRWPLGGLVASLGVGIAVAAVVHRAPAWLHLLNRDRSRDLSTHHRQETR